MHYEYIGGIKKKRSAGCVNSDGMHNASVSPGWYSFVSLYYSCRVFFSATRCQWWTIFARRNDWCRIVRSCVIEKKSSQSFVGLERAQRMIDSCTVSQRVSVTEECLLQVTINNLERKISKKMEGKILLVVQCRFFF